MNNGNGPPRGNHTEAGKDSVLGRLANSFSWIKGGS
jgi:hypothetical protein